MLLLFGAVISSYKIKKIYYLSTITFFMLPAIVFWFYYSMTGNLIHADTLMAIYQTNSAEAKSYLREYLSVSSILFIIIAILIIVTINFAMVYLPTFSFSALKNKYCILLFIAIILLSNYLIRQNNDNIYWTIYKGTQEYVQQYTAFATNQKNRKHHEISFTVDNNSKEGVYFLVLGESQNRNHMSAYGYTRDTTPWLAEKRNDSSFILYDNAYSCHTHTVPVQTYALTSKNQYNTIKPEDALSLIEVAKAAGFHTVWLSNQVQYSTWDTPISVIASEADEQQWINKNIGETTKTNYYDEKLVDCLKQITPKDKMLIIIHLMGNHGSYEDRYPNTYNKYNGENRKLDTYDNSILYNDDVMKKLYETAKAFPHYQSLVYYADHADAVDQDLAHDSSQFVFPMTYIPFYMAFSPEYQHKHPNKIATLKAHHSDYFTNDLIFNVMLSIMGISLGDIDEPQNDISNKMYDNDGNRFTTLYGQKMLEYKN